MQDNDQPKWRRMKLRELIEIMWYYLERVKAFYIIKNGRIHEVKKKKEYNPHFYTRYKYCATTLLGMR